MHLVETVWILVYEFRRWTAMKATERFILGNPLIPHERQAFPPVIEKAKEQFQKNMNY